MCMNTKKLKEIAKNIVYVLYESGFEAYFVGGAVRDMLMGIEPKDYDIATNATTKDVSSLFKRVIPVGVQFGVSIVVIEGEEFQIATFRSDGKYIDGRHPENINFSSAKEDAQRRDFTINGLFYNPLIDRVIDFVDGKKDIDNKLIVAIGDPYARFDEDKLRILRALRFANRFNFKIETETAKAIKKFVPLINQVSQERIRDELVKMLTGPSPAQALDLLDKFDLLDILLPEVSNLKGVEQIPEFHPEGDVFEHTMLMLKHLSHPTVELVFAVLLHDIGKPDTFIPETLKTPCHSDVGARIAIKILRRLRFSNEQIEVISWAVRNHMNFMHVQKMRIGKLKRLMMRDTFKLELELHRIDCLSCHGMLDNYYFLLEKEKEFEKEELKPKPLVSGKDIIALGLKPGPYFKEIIDEALTLQLENTFSSKEEALMWLKQRVEK